MPIDKVQTPYHCVQSLLPSGLCLPLQHPPVHSAVTTMTNCSQKTHAISRLCFQTCCSLPEILYSHLPLTLTCKDIFWVTSLPHFAYPVTCITFSFVLHLYFGKSSISAYTVLCLFIKSSFLIRLQATRRTILCLCHFSIPRTQEILVELDLGLR